MVRVLATMTLPLRHWLVRRLAPKVYFGAMQASSYGAFPRPMILAIKNMDYSDLLGVEIGVARGLNAESIMNTLDMQRLYLVDPYEPYLQGGYFLFGYTALEQVAKDRLSCYKDRVKFIKGSSQDRKVVSSVPDDLDFVYIDGNHTYESVKRDIELWYSKVTSGGIIGGHDYSWSYNGVINAVAGFATVEGLNIQGGIADWYVVKP